jgi:hypothetical protein
MEMDTTTLFNSSLKKSVTITSVGGILEFNPQMSFTDSTVYYWRTAMVPDQGSPILWSKASFLFRNGQQTGFNQSHFYQHTIQRPGYLDSATRTGIYNQSMTSLSARRRILRLVSRLILHQCE